MYIVTKNALCIYVMNLNIVDIQITYAIVLACFTDDQEAFSRTYDASTL